MVRGTARAGAGGQTTHAIGWVAAHGRDKPCRSLVCGDGLAWTLVVGGGSPASTAGGAARKKTMPMTITRLMPITRPSLASLGMAAPRGLIRSLYYALPPAPARLAERPSAQ